ncbi:hypothetical protein MMC11_003828 [Xylographa trunciseda]|nr:hypothetical protein [Xylographa trunciseda]
MVNGQKTNGIAKPNAHHQRVTKDELKYTCKNCGKSYTRKQTVKQHYEACVTRNGNPNNVAWDDHPSCWPKQGRARFLKLQIFGGGDQDAEMSGIAESSSMAGVHVEDNEVAHAASEHNREEEDEEMADVTAYATMSPEQHQGVETHVRDGMPLEGRSVNWLFPFPDRVIGPEGYVLPTVYSVHGEGSNEHVHRSVVPNHWVHPGLAHGANTQARTNPPFGKMNDSTLDPMLPGHTPQQIAYPDLPSDTPQQSAYPYPMEPNGLPNTFFIASSLPGASKYGQTHRPPYSQINYHEKAMASSDTLVRTDAVGDDHAGEHDADLQIGDSHESQIRSNLQARESYMSRIGSSFQTEESFESRVQPNLHAGESYVPRTDSSLQPGDSHESHIRSNHQATESYMSRIGSSLQPEESHGSRIDPGLLFADVPPNVVTNRHGDRKERQIAPYLPYFEQKAKNPESLDALDRRMQEVKDDMLRRLRNQPGHVSAAADRELVDQLFNCGEHDEASDKVVSDFRNKLKYNLRSTARAQASTTARLSVLADPPVHSEPSQLYKGPTLDGSDIESRKNDNEGIRSQDNLAVQNSKKPSTMIDPGTMNRIAAIGILAGREGAAEDVYSAQVIWRKWHALLPQGTTSDVAIPTADDSVKERQLKVVHMAQESIAALIARARDLAEQMKVVKKIREVLYFMNKDEEAKNIRQMLAEDGVERQLLPAK